MVIAINVWNRNSDLKREAERKDRNISALHADINSYINKDSTSGVQKKALETTIAGLEEFNDSLYSLAKNRKGDIITLNRIVASLKLDTTNLGRQIRNFNQNTTQVNDSTYLFEWTDTRENTFKVSGQSIVGFSILQTPPGINNSDNIFRQITLSHNARITNVELFDIELSFGQERLKDQVRVFVESSSKYRLSASTLEGVYVDYPKKRHWFTGFGIGPSISMGYNFVESKPGLIFGASLHYNIYQW